ncbi:uncharacterized protein LOC129890481 [Solanum dulcamara]|uniref:uncharacterized protein LOC129890481 n=1 Tax=Solanum dulcamara TaxID=45834 RepID=UPI0024868633|nr:uncharacterized protein LOC129890481 [Solanum dulcamara]
MTWITYLLHDLGVFLKSVPTLYCDNLSVLYMTVNPVMHARIKYVEMDYHFVREKVAKGQLLTQFVRSKDQLDDIHTKALTKKLRYNIEQGIDRPWIIAGDFNAVLYPKDRLHGAPVSSAETQASTKCLHDLHLNELPWKGDYYTWSNKQMGTDRIYSRIDRIFGNSDWMMHWGHVVTQYEVPYISDHSPMLIKIEDNQWTVKPPFRFFNIWADHSKFMEKVTEIWHKQLVPGKMANIWAKLKALQKILKTLNKEEFQNISTRINEARLELIQTQKQINQQCTDELLCKERQALMNIEK